jgi:isopenicillin-N N-acyltransferase-like protein
VRVHHHDSGHRSGPERARRFGAGFARPIDECIAAYREHFRRLGISDATVTEVATSSWEALASWAPDLADEVAGLAGGAEVPLLELVALNARTEVLATGPPVDECSTAVRLPDPGAGAPVSFQTWDWHAPLAPGCALWTYRTDTGRRVRTFTELGMLAKIGLNDAGLSVNFNILHHSSDTGTGGVPVHAVARRILDEATSVADAITVATSAPVCASTVLTVLAGSQAACIELSPSGVGLVRPDPAGWLVHTNHFLDPALAPAGRLAPSSTSVARYEHLAETLNDDVDTSSLSTFARDLCGEAGPASPLCVHPNPTLPVHQRVQTLLSVRMAPGPQELEYFPGTPAEAAAAQGGTPATGARDGPRRPAPPVQRRTAAAPPAAPPVDRRPNMSARWGREGNW